MKNVKERSDLAKLIAPELAATPVPDTVLFLGAQGYRMLTVDEVAVRSIEVADAVVSRMEELGWL